MTLQTDLASAVAKASADAEKLHQIVHGPDTATVATEGGTVKSVAKLLKDADERINQDAAGVLAQSQAEAAAAATSASQAAASEAAAASSAAAAAASEASAAASKNAAATSAANAATSEANAGASATSATASAVTAATKATEAANSAAAASASQTGAASSQSAAAASASAAATSEANATVSAAAAASSQAAAASSATNAASSAQLAADWAQKTGAEVAPGQGYSAKHWAQQAQSFASGAASNISVTPTGGVQSTNVQAALAELDTEKLAKGGDAMTGPLALAGDPTQPLHAAPKQYVDSGLAGKQPALGYAPVNRAGDEMSGNLGIANGAPTLGLRDTDTNRTRSVHHNAEVIGFLGSDGAWKQHVNDSGQVWTAGYGWLHDYFLSSVGGALSRSGGQVSLNPIHGGLSWDSYSMGITFDAYGRATSVTNCNCNCG